MEIEALKNEGVYAFVNYCRKHRGEIDDSFLYDEDLRSFELNNENPTYIIRDENGEVKAAASLIIDSYNRRGRKARFRIFHSEIDDINTYEMLLKAVLKHTEGIDKLFIFIPVVNNKLKELIESLKFSIDRYAFFLVREDMEVPYFILQDGYEIRPFVADRDEETWCMVRNAGFAKLKGNETPITKEMVSKMISSDDNIDGGSMILFHGDKPVGVVRGSKDEYEGIPVMHIGPLAIITEYQGRGLGRIMLRAVIKFAREKAYKRVVLSVNAENERAKSLYLQEGFKQEEAVVCYRYDVGVFL